MAVTSATSSISYTGNNSTTTSYAVPFVFLENSHLAATAKVTATGVETAVTLVDHIGAGNPNGGNVRTAVAVPATSTLTIFRTVPATQTTTYQEGGDFPAASHERALDKLTFLAQQNERIAERSIRVTEADGARNDLVAAANTVIGLDGNKQPKTMTASDLKTYLALTGVTLDVDAGIKTFADAGERALAVPDFAGQLGTQRDTADIYISTGTSAGNWSLVDENMSLADFASGFFTADATGRGKFGSGFVDAGMIASDAVTTAKILNANVTTAKIADAAITPTKLSQPYTLATSVASTSGTAIDFTGIPSWARRITVMFNGVSTNGTSNLQIQIGAGSIVSTGYTSGAWTANIANASITTGFLLSAGSIASTAVFGNIIISNISGNTWVESHSLGGPASNYNSVGGGSVSLSGTLDRIRITTVNGTDTFDAGSINIAYEG